VTLNIKIVVFIDFLATLHCETHFKSELRRIHYRYTGQAACKFSALNVDFNV